MRAVKTITALAEQPNATVFFLPDITILAMAQQVVELVRQHGLPTIYTDLNFVKVGGLACYGVDRTELFRRAAGYVDRILRGERPGDLPFQQPTSYQLVINLKAAKAIGLNIPPTLLGSADEVIE
jgi:putative ABC transport system substrate-binding protein